MCGEMKNKNVVSVLADTSFISRAEALVPLFGDGSAQYAVFPGFCDVHVHFLIKRPW